MGRQMGKAVEVGCEFTLGQHCQCLALFFIFFSHCLTQVPLTLNIRSVWRLTAVRQVTLKIPYCPFCPGASTNETQGCYSMSSVGNLEVVHPYPYWLLTYSCASSVKIIFLLFNLWEYNLIYSYSFMKPMDFKSIFNILQMLKFFCNKIKIVLQCIHAVLSIDGTIST
jgi:hypothetical protein